MLLCNHHYAAVPVVEEDAHQPVWLWCISIIVNVGMWLERFVIVVTSLHRDFLHFVVGNVLPTRWDWMTFIGTIGMFLTAMFLFVRILPMISIFEMRTLLPARSPSKNSPMPLASLKTMSRL
jgi:hypothetical protein